MRHPIEVLIYCRVPEFERELEDQNGKALYKTLRLMAGKDCI